MTYSQYFCDVALHHRMAGARCLTFQNNAVVPSAASFMALTLALSPTGLGI